MTTTVIENFKIVLNTLIDKAEQQGLVITIDLVNETPLAMGNYKMVPDVRLARNLPNTKD